jgi:hypothetical protein
MMNNETVQQPTASELLQRVATQNEHIRVLRENIEAENRGYKSYLTSLSGYYGGLSWWKQILVDMAFMTASYLITTLLFLPTLLLLPIAGIYFMGAFFLNNHYNAHSLNTNSLHLLEDTLTESIDALTNTRTLLNLLSAEAAHLNETLDDEVDVLEAQNERFDNANTVFENTNITLDPLIRALSAATQSTQENSQEIIHILNQIHHALGIESNTLLRTTLPRLNTTLDALEASGVKMASTEVNYQERLTHLNTLIQLLSHHLESQETSVTTTEFINATRNRRLESDAIMAEARSDLARQTPSSPSVRFFDGSQAPSEINKTTPRADI